MTHVILSTGAASGSTLAPVSDDESEVEIGGNSCQHCKTDLPPLLVSAVIFRLVAEDAVAARKVAASKSGQSFILAMAKMSSNAATLTWFE